MPQDHGCWLDQHQRIEDLRPRPIKPYPEEPICGEEPKPTGVLAPRSPDVEGQ
jgi:hypothetical protein